MDDVKQRIESIESVNRRIVATLVRLEGKLDAGFGQIRSEMATKISGVMQALDGVSGQLEDLRYRYAVHADTLQQHDTRLKKLEKRS